MAKPPKRNTPTNPLNDTLMTGDQVMKMAPHPCDRIHASSESQKPTSQRLALESLDPVRGSQVDFFRPLILQTSASDDDVVFDEKTIGLVTDRFG